MVTMGAFFWDYSRIGILGIISYPYVPRSGEGPDVTIKRVRSGHEIILEIEGICVLLGAIPFSE